MATPSMAPQGNGNGSKWLDAISRLWPIFGGLVLVLGAYYTLAAQTSQNAKDVAAMQQKMVSKEELQFQMQYMHDSLERIEHRQEQMDLKFDQIQRRQRDR